MTELLTAAQMRAVEQAAIDSGEVTGLELMERAGRGVVEAVFEEWPELAQAPHRAVVLCGPGNNGGDGFVVARLLHDWGWEVAVLLYGDAEKLPPDARVNFERWCDRGEVKPYIDEGDAAFWLEPQKYREETLVVDALFGTGLSRPVEHFNAFGWVTQISEWRSNAHQRQGQYPAPRVVAIDIPSGVCADSGKRLKSNSPPRDLEKIRADLTVSFHNLKPGHVLGGGPDLCGKVVVKDIGLKGGPQPRWGVKPSSGAAVEGCPVVPPGERVKLVERPSRTCLKSADTHKYTHGHALIVSGTAGHTGAARLAAGGALRIGAGLVTVAAPTEAMAENAAHLTAIMLREVPDSAALSEELRDERLNALCIGPGLGFRDESLGLIEACLKSGRACVLDADALTLIARDPALFAMLHDRCVLTPHGGEFARLFHDIAKRLGDKPMSGPAYSRVDATREAAALAGCTVLFKGPDTIIADLKGRASINSAHYDRTAPWLATAGSGDVLSGFIVGLLARGFAPMQAAETAAWLHVECARSFGPGLIAEDLPDELPKVFRNLKIP